MSSPYVGEIRMFGGNFAPNGWMLCQGQTLAISDWVVLFELIGTTYGGDGVATFMLPNLSSRFPAHQGSGYQLGQLGGVESVALTGQQIPAHSHVPLAALVATSTSPSGAYWASYANLEYNSRAPVTPMASNALRQAGGSQPHDNMSPYLVINFIIAMYGIFPTPT